MNPEATHSPAAPTSDDLLAQEAIKQSVRQAYRGVVGTASTVARRLYDPDQLALLPPGAKPPSGALAVSPGPGAHVEHA